MTDSFVIKNGILESYLGNNTTVIIPSIVTRIGKRAFANSSIRTVSFEGNGLKSIDEEAFFKCSNLEYILIPDGVIQIGDRAFYGCNSLEYVKIPDSLMVTGDYILGNCNKNLLILGNKAGEAGDIAKKFGFVLKTDVNQTLSAHNKAKLTRAALETKAFDILGETVICSNSLARYHENVEYYSHKKETLFKKFISQFPATIFAPFGDLLAVLDVETDVLVNRLSKQGVFIKRKIVEAQLVAPYQAIVDAATAIKNVHTTIASDVANGISNDRRALFNEAESKVVGLGYGMIGDTLDMIAYSIDDYRARRQQQEEAYAEANQKLEASKQMYTSQGNQLYTDFFNRISPALRHGTDMLLDTLCRVENEQLMNAGIIDPQIVEKIDIPKSAQLIASVADTPGDNAFTVALAIKKYPCNIAALVYACEHKYNCEGLTELISFLGLQDRIDSGIKESKSARYRTLLRKMEKALSGNQGISTIKVYEELLGESQVKKLLQALADTITPLVEKLAPKKLDSIVDTDAYWTDLLSEVIDRESWEFFEKYGVLPVHKTKTIPETAVLSFEKMIAWLSEKIKHEKIVADKYNEYLNKYPEIRKKESYQERRKIVRTTIEENKAGITDAISVQWGARIIGIAMLVAGFYTAEVSDGFTILIGFAGAALCGWLMYKYREPYKLAMELKQEERELTKKLEAIEKLPPFVE